MSAGDLIHLDRQAELDGVLIGEGTRFQVESWDLFALPDVRTKDTDRNDLGVQPGVDSYGGRLLRVDVWLDSVPDIAQMVADRATLESAFAPSNETRQLHFRLDGTRFCYIGRGRGISTDMPSRDAWPVECRFMATDPRLFSGVEHVADLDITGTTTLTNAGTRSTPWRWTVTGPLDFPALSLADDAATYTFAFPDLQLEADDVLVVDSLLGTALLNGTSVIGQARDDSGLRLPFPWAFQPGDVDWAMDCADADGSATLAWRDAWA